LSSVRRVMASNLEAQVVVGVAFVVVEEERVGAG
jgi:hypothetical protein